MNEKQLTLENLTQDVLDTAWDIWYRYGYPGLEPYRYPTPTVERVRERLKSWSVAEYRLGIKGWGHAKLWIERRRTVVPTEGSTPIYFAADANDYGKPPEVREKNKQIIESMTDAWKEAGLPVEP